MDEARNLLENERPGSSQLRGAEGLLMTPVRVLVADDHALVRQGIRSLLESRLGWQVVGEAKNGREAVEKAAELRPDVVILDITMPELNGIEATRQIVKAVPETEVLILTMHESE